MDTLYLFPTAEEAVGLLAWRADLEAKVGIIGVGMAEAAAEAARLITLHHPRRVVLCGIAGACGLDLRVGDVVQVESDRVAGLPERYSVEYRSLEIEGLRRVESLSVSGTGESRTDDAEHTLPLIEQMEGAAVAAVCRKLGVEEYYHLRAISNHIDTPFSEWRIAQAVEALGVFVAKLDF